VDDFPLDVFPDYIVRLCQKASKNFQCPVDYLAVSIMTAVSAAVGKNIKIFVKNGWEERPCQFTAIIGPSGSKKTPAISLAVEPIHGKQNEMHEIFVEELKRYKREKRKYDKLDNNEKKRAEEPEKPVYHQIETTNTTMEGLFKILPQNPDRLIMYKDELSSWVKSNNMYRQGEGDDSEHWLSMWSGTPILVNRVNADPIWIKEPSINILGGIVSDNLEIMNNKNFLTDGSIARMLMSYPDYVKMPWADEDFRSEMDEYSAMILILLADNVERTITFDEMSAARFRKWHDQHNEEMFESDFPNFLKASWSKLMAYVARTCILFHQLTVKTENRVSNIVSLKTLDDSIRVIDYFKDHLIKVFHFLMSSKEELKMNEALGWIKNQKNGKITVRDAQRKRLCGMTKASDIKALFGDLVNDGHGKTNLLAHNVMEFEYMEKQPV
jgi:Protein of unknown function (DUF3987)